MAKKIFVIGAGNLLLRDEGVGIHVIKELQKRELPAEVEIVDGGVGGLDLLHYFSQAEKVLLIDAAEMGLEPGAVVRLDPAQVNLPLKEVQFSAHEISLAEVIELGRALTNNSLKIVIFGIQPKEISWGMELSPEVAAVIPQVITAVFQEINSFLEKKEQRETSLPSRRRFFLKGVVQGVGFRPFVYGLASGYGLAGWVNNSSAGVHIEVEGPRAAIEKFTTDLKRKAPPRARVEALDFWDLPPGGYEAFEIRESVEEGGEYQLISPDIATCSACQEEIFNPADRRYRYPFTNCTNCGPRFTIIKDIPYDRPKTTMAKFSMCAECRREYEDPADRRFHAQPNACPQCGPRLEIWNNAGEKIPASDPLKLAIQFLQAGKIVALKGLGGFLLAGDAQNRETVRRLRERKRRPAKPLAVMFPNLAKLKEHCWVNEQEEEILRSPESPIVLLRWKENSPIVPEVAPGQKYLGAMLPYTPLHHLLLQESGLILVMTSGNLSEEPIAKDNEEAIKRLGGIADAFLLHDRDIYVQYDDSVVAVIDGETSIIRRARGYAPFPIKLPMKLKPILACGGELKNTFCLTRDHYAFVSQHIGDMENLETLEHFQRTIKIYQELFRIQPEWIAYDLHPEYLSSKYALHLPGQKIGVQHHFAHLVSCLAENEVDGPTIGLTFDGLGYGADGTLWGGEFLIGDYHNFHRYAHLEYMPLPGGAAAIKNPWRMALAYTYILMGKEELLEHLLRWPISGSEKIYLILQQIDKKINSPLTSSLGRLFDGVAALLGLCSSISYEGQAAVELEMIADTKVNMAYDFEIEEEGGQEVIRLKPIWAGILKDLAKEVSPAEISGKFHNTIVEMSLHLCQQIARRRGIKRVALSGGVFQNRLLLQKLKNILRNAGFEVFTHHLIPSNDGGISLGQAVIAHFATK
ncbi:MAG: carbamoyltransferase HypF [bacterium]